MIKNFNIILSNLTQRNKLQLSVLIFIILVGALLEFVGLSSIIPLLTIIIQGDESVRLFFNNNNINYFDNFNYNEFVQFWILVILFSYGFKTIFLTFATYYQNNTLFNFVTILSAKIYKIYLKMDYIDFIDSNSSLKFRNIVQETERLVVGYILPVIFILTELIIVTAVSIALYIYEPKGFLMSATSLFILGILFSKLSKNFIISLGKKRLDYQGRRYKSVNEGLSAFKSIRIHEVASVFLKKYSQLTSKEIGTQANIYTFVQLPKFWTEFIAIIVVSILLIYLVNLGISQEELLTKIGVFLICSFRLIPSVNRILIALQSLRSSFASVNAVCQELNRFIPEVKKPDIKKMFFKDKISINNLDFKHKGTKKLILKNFNLDIRKNECLALTGASGVGKSTLIDLIMGFHKPDYGEILVDGEDIFKNIIGWNRNIGYVPQNIFLLDDTIKSNIAFGVNSNDINEDKLQDAIKLSQLSNFIENLSKKSNTQVGERGNFISGGQLQRIGIARALYASPDLLIFDEVTSSLDEETEKSFLSVIRNLKGKKTMILISHKKSTISVCDREIHLENKESHL